MTFLRISLIILRRTLNKFIKSYGLDMVVIITHKQYDQKQKNFCQKV